MYKISIAICLSIFVVFTGMNLVKFCKDNNLTRSNICKVIVGTRNHHKGWTKLFP